MIEDVPRLPERFMADEHSTAVWTRWHPYLVGDETLSAAAYACLTYVENVYATSRASAAERLRVSRKVLNSVGRLTSDAYGDDATARKFGSAARRRHTDAQRAFLEAAITAVIRRLGELAAATDAETLSQIRLADLPEP